MILLGRKEVAGLLTLDDCIDAVETAFRLHGEGKLARPGVLGVHCGDGGFHIKAATLQAGRSYFAAKVNGNFPQNEARHGLPAIQGVIVLSDAANGRPLAVMDSIEITILRTGAATAVAARRLARRGAKVAAICGCGNQGRVQLRALSRVIRLEQVFAWDIDRARAERFAAQMAQELGLRISAVSDAAAALERGDVCVTCTPSRSPFVRRELLKPGAFVAAVGADNEEKQELDAAVTASSKLVVDVLDQCATIGELHHALAAGLMKREAVHAELGEVVAGRRAARESDEELIVFDSTGTALEDVAVAWLAYERAVADGVGMAVDLGGA